MDFAKYAALFQAESREHLRDCNRLLLEWEQSPAAREPVDGVFRAIHTIKGMAATMGYASVADLAHRAESLLDAIRTGRLAARPDYVDVLLRTVDALEAGIAAPATDALSATETQLLGLLESAALGAAPREKEGAAPAKRLAKPKGRGLGASKSGATNPAPDARQLVVRVALKTDAMMRGARALLALRKAEALGMVSRVDPPVAALERDEFDGVLSFALESSATDDAIAAAIRSTGDIGSVQVREGLAAAAAVDTTRQIRVDLDRLDVLMKLGGELVVARNRLADLAAQLGDAELLGLNDRLSRLVGRVQAEVIAARMTPVREVFDRFPRVVRDLGRELGKQVKLVVEGSEIELDRSVLDEIGDPLLHLVRNAVDHGIEPPEVRQKAGKAAEGRLRLSAIRERETVAITVTDDGRGIDRQRVLAKAQREGLADNALEALSDELLLRIIARAGFSTADAVSGVSGRGVGVDVVMTRLRSLGGAVELASEPGRGTTFVLRVPLTLAIVRALMVQVGDERYVFPLGFVAETVEYSAQRSTVVGEREALVVRDRPVPTVHLRRLFAVRGEAPSVRRPAVIVDIGGRRTALIVDALLGQQEIVVEPFEAPRGMPPWFSGATLLADGTPALIVDAASLG